MSTCKTGKSFAAYPGCTKIPAIMVHLLTCCEVSEIRLILDEFQYLITIDVPIIRAQVAKI